VVWLFFALLLVIAFVSAAHASFLGARTGSGQTAQILPNEPVADLSRSFPPGDLESLV
jgi:hypothetical protein